MYDYTTGAEEVGVDPTAGANENVQILESKSNNEGDIQDFKEYDINEYEAKEIDPNNYEDSFYEFNTNGAKPTSSAYEDEFGPGRPAETEVTESNVSLLHFNSTSAWTAWQEFLWNLDFHWCYCL